MQTLLLYKRNEETPINYIINFRFTKTLSFTVYKKYLVNKIRKMYCFTRRNLGVILILT